MEILELISESLAIFRQNKIRTGLAMLGVIIGIGSVIALMSLGQASQQSITNQIQSLGSNLLTISPGAQFSGNVRGGGRVETLTYDDAKAILSSGSVTTVEKVSAEYSSNAQIVAGKNNTNTSVNGVSAEYAEIRNVEIANGTFITDRNVSSMAKVAVLGPDTVTDLFGENSNPIGQTIRINGQVFTVVGVTVAKGGSGFNSQDDIVYVPLTTAQKLLFGANYVSSISIQAKSGDVMELAQSQITSLLLTRHKITDPASADFRIFSQDDLLSTVSEVTGTFTTLLTGIAAISLVVGGIGIMNIMLVTVTERTREIGLRKALGAKRKAIISQFLTEAIMITLIGGMIGTAIGIGISYFLSKSMSLDFVLSIPSIGLAFGVSMAVGVLFGWYPAYKAARLEPIEALRYE